MATDASFTQLSVYDVNKILSDYQHKLEQISENQGNVKKFVDQEASILQQQDQEVKNQKTNVNRLVSFNQSFTKKYNEYIRIVTTIILTLAVMYVLMMLYKKYPDYEAFILLAMIFIGSYAAIRILNIFAGIQMRDNMDFDKVKTEPPPMAIDISGQLAANAQNGNLLAALDLGACVGSQCCKHVDGSNNSTKWSPELQKCVAENFTNMESMSEEIISNIGPKPYEKFQLFTPFM